MLSIKSVQKLLRRVEDYTLRLPSTSHKVHTKHTAAATIRDVTKGKLERERFIFF